MLNYKLENYLIFSLRNSKGESFPYKEEVVGAILTEGTKNNILLQFSFTKILFFKKI